jgi:hypothetical protein
MPITMRLSGMYSPVDHRSSPVSLPHEPKQQNPRISDFSNFDDLAIPTSIDPKRPLECRVSIIPSKNIKKTFKGHASIFVVRKDNPTVKLLEYSNIQHSFNSFARFAKEEKIEVVLTQQYPNSAVEMITKKYFIITKSQFNQDIFPIYLFLAPNGLIDII